MCSRDVECRIVLQNCSLLLEGACSGVVGQAVPPGESLGGLVFVVT